MCGESQKEQIVGTYKRHLMNQKDWVIILSVVTRLADCRFTIADSGVNLEQILQVMVR